jgi:7-carboxy-7-deazaguanine synthase
MVMEIRVKEIFSSLQGEGPAIGQPATFIRLSGCNLSCSYCDTDHEGGKDYSLEKIMALVEVGPSRVVITGGEPMLAGPDLVPLAEAITETGRILDIETNGTMAPPPGLVPLVDNYVISPKLSNSGNPPESRQLAPDLPNGPFKFSIDTNDDLEEARRLAASNPGREVIVMPLGTDAEAMLKKMNELCDDVQAMGWRLLPRLQVLLGIR